MDAVIFLIKQEMGGIEKNIEYYTKLHYSVITDEDRAKTISDLVEIKDQYLKAIEILNDNSVPQGN